MMFEHLIEETLQQQCHIWDRMNRQLGLELRTCHNNFLIQPFHLFTSSFTELVEKRANY